MSTPESDQLELQVFFRRSLRSSTQHKRPMPYLDPKHYVYYLRRQVALSNGVKPKNKRKSEDTDVTLELPSVYYLLQKLKEDLQAANKKFLLEFVAEPQNGVRLVLDLLNSCWRIQIDQELSWIHDSERQFLLRNALREEHECLLCLKNCIKLKEAVTMVMKHSNGLSTLAFCITSNCRKSRLLALQLLTTVCQASFDGNERVLEAMTSVKLAYGESVRFKFMMSMLKSGTRNSTDFKCAVLVLINTILLRTHDLDQKVRLQCEFKEAGLNILKLEEELFEKTTPTNDSFWKEISKWKERYVNIQEIMSESQQMASQIKALKNEVEHLHKMNKKLEAQKRSLMHAEIKKLETTEMNESYYKEIKSPHQYPVDIIGSGHPNNDEIIINVPTVFSSKKKLASRSRASASYHSRQLTPKTILFNFKLRKKW
ncbi:uncharacterized protein LOC111086361 [Limulus polyphemus]|uniref:Uncharacterized protein LOC111086361 n=1 Tax=Limulus polyphemus TaxID=6850 RepID=A0ABM1SLX3_LIMPO|nr:uncharacterized protein LOC111086361 [Limulus polyphemus]